MGIDFDTHIHTDFSTDSTTPVREQIKRAEQLSLAGLCFTDHIDYDFPEGVYESKKPLAGPPFVFDIDSYQSEIRRAASDFPDIEILTGVECGMQLMPKTIQKNKALAEDKELDYLIGSLHLVDRKDPYYSSFWEKEDATCLVRRYFEQIYNNLLQFHDFDSLGHLDYIVRYAPDSFVYEPQEYQDIVTEILRFIIRHDIALEINTSGWKATAFPNPHPDILRWYVKLGGQLITIGSDAHVPEYLGFSFDRLTELLPEQLGIHEYAVYRKHKPEIRSLL